MILQGFNLLFGAVSIFLKDIEKRFVKQVQKHEKQKTVVEMQANSIRNRFKKRCQTTKSQKLNLKRFFLR